jgi:hypothetical protein
VAKQINIPDFARRVRNLGGEMKTAVQLGMVKAAQRLEVILVDEIDKAQPYPAVDRGQLRNSVRVRTTATGTIFAGVDAPHAPYIEDGTRPFWAPLQPLIDWVRRKGLADNDRDVESIARAVQHHIATHGIKPRHYMRKAFARFKADNVMAKTVGGELRKLARKNGGK